jgi:hypothetical protein
VLSMSDLVASRSDWRFLERTTKDVNWFISLSPMKAGNW